MLKSEIISVLCDKSFSLLSVFKLHQMRHDCEVFYVLWVWEVLFYKYWTETVQVFTLWQGILFIWEHENTWEDPY